MFTVLDYLERTTEQFPENIICEDERESVSFREFVSNAKKIGTCLCRYAQTNQPVAVFMENTAQSWIAMVGAVYSGNFYAVVDAQTPIERLKDIVQSISPIAVIVDEKCRTKGQELEGIDVLFYDEIIKTEANNTVLTQVRHRMIDTDPVYALFTSGSTGVPKGTVVNHASVIKYTQWYAGTFGIDETTIFGSQTPFYFSMSVATMFSALLTGASLVVIPKRLFSFPLELIQFMNEKQINTIYWVPSAMNIIANRKALDNHDLPSLKKVLFCGEVMPMKPLNYWRAHLPEDTLFANLYGPTETTDVAAYYIVDRKFHDDEVLPIGRPCANCSVMVLKQDDTLAQPGEEGELCIRGSFLACGYYNNPEKTAEVFTQNPLNKSYPELIYRTGDIVKYNEYGELMYITRKDFQIKHQGYRIELGEIEAAVGAMESVFECACVYDMDKQLIVMFYSGQELKPGEILQSVRDRLPKYMMPNKFVFLPELPHNANGKIDKKQLKQTYFGAKQ